ncbi:hypothetical protein CI109_102644 [Kwoniella shandongensis]|uniref:Aminoglycoside phosphotransferase domain-containing protein n=1 Tax=Kwoniella shandongensis TaxID=1734106 RepID=A0AAJ8LJ23_9TREE
MLTWICSYSGCDSRSVSYLGDCHHCSEHYCVTHFALPHHKCLELDDDASEKERQKVDAIERHHILNLMRRAHNHIVQQAQHLRAGHACSLKIQDDVDDFVCGGFNVHFLIIFDDEMKWIVRVRLHNFNNPPREAQKIALESEIETVKYMREKNVVFIPEVYSSAMSYEGEKENDCLDYFFMELMTGTPYRGSIMSGPQTPTQISRTIHDLALHYISLSKVHFPSIGSLYPSTSTSPNDGPSTIGPLVQNALCLPEQPWFLGPFHSNKERYITYIDEILLRIERGLMYQSNPLFAYLSHLETREMVESHQGWGDESVFYLKHDDDKGDHIMVDESGGITGLIDWQWAYTTSKAEAFAAPLALLTAYDLYDSGTNDLTQWEHALIEEYEDMGHPDLADCVRGGRLYHHLYITIGDEPNMINMECLREAFGRERLGHETYEEWGRWGWDKYGDYEGLKRVYDRYFPQSD